MAPHRYELCSSAEHLDELAALEALACGTTLVTTSGTAMDEVATIPLGFWRPKTAYRKDITGIVECDYGVFWNARRA